MTWRALLESWRPADVRGYAADELDEAPLPPELRRYYQLAGRLPTWNLHLVPPGELGIRDDGRLPFIDEEQGVYSFATLPVGDDPPVWLRDGGHETELTEPLSRFLLQYVVFEASGRGFGGWGYVRRADLPDLRRRLPPLPLGTWPHPSRNELSFHASDRLIGLVFEGGDDLVEVHVSGRDAEALAPLDSLIEWDEGHPLVR